MRPTNKELNAMNYRTAFSSFSVNDIESAEDFYRDKLGLTVSRDEYGLNLHLTQQESVFIYPKGDHSPATHTVLNFVVGDLAAEVDALAADGIGFERYEEDHMGVDERGIHTGGGMAVAWFKDPAGNWISLIEHH